MFDSWSMCSILKTMFPTKLWSISLSFPRIPCFISPISSCFFADCMGGQGGCSVSSHFTVPTGAAEPRMEDSFVFTWTKTTCFTYWWDETDVVGHKNNACHLPLEILLQRNICIYHSTCGLHLIRGPTGSIIRVPRAKTSWVNLAELPCSSANRVSIGVRNEHDGIMGCNGCIRKWLVYS